LGRLRLQWGPVASFDSFRLKRAKKARAICRSIQYSIKDSDFCGIASELWSISSLIRTMTKKQNPYQLWLGLPADLVSPDFYQLLDISPDATDNKEIASGRAS